MKTTEQQIIEILLEKVDELKEKVSNQQQLVDFYKNSSEDFENKVEEKENYISELKQTCSDFLLENMTLKDKVEQLQKALIIQNIDSKAKMNSFALSGHKVYCKQKIALSEELSKRYPVVGEEYTVEKTVIYDNITEVYLKEYPNEVFASSFFVDVNPQPIEKSREHPQWDAAADE